MELLKCLITGIVVGSIFAGFKLPIPAPVVIEGIAGIMGIFLGYKIIQILM